MSPKEYFESRVKSNSADLKRLKSIAFMLSMSRIAVFVLVSVLIYFFWKQTLFAVSTGILGFIIFTFLIKKYADVRIKRDYHKLLVALNNQELEGLKGDYSSFGNGSEFLNDDHAFNRDIDLFGEGSLFQRINRTGTIRGSEKLAQLLNENRTDLVMARQDAIKELQCYSDWRQDFQASSTLIEHESEAIRLIEWAKNYKTVVPKIFRWFPQFYTIVSLTVVVLGALSIIPISFALIPFFIGLFITMLYVKKINLISAQTSKVERTFFQYSQLIELIESKDFQAELLMKEKDRLEEGGNGRASEVLKKLSKILSSLDQRNNILFVFVANGFALWDIRYSFQAEDWIKNNIESVEEWLSALASIEALNSLANFAFIHVDYNFPQIAEGEEVLKCVQLGHPLISLQKRVDNDVQIALGNFQIVTGANMAGKSTFLRTIALNIVMANSGLPVCAKEFIYTPIKLISSMRTSDSLKDDESYFFSELKRLKFVINEVQKDTYFIILDEILKGTNSKDKAEGSKKFIERLVSTKATGIIATHDLSLCALADQYPVVTNLSFEALIENDELLFDYKLKEGVCQNMNASFLLKKMGIVH